MDTAYRNWEKRRVRPRSGRTEGRRGAKVALGVRERKRLAQLVVCGVLFLVVFIGKGVFPDKMVAIRDGLTQVMGSNTDFRAAFADLGKSISNGAPLLDTLGGLCIEVFGGSRVAIAPRTQRLLPTYRDQKAFLNQPVTATSMLKHNGWIPLQPAPIEAVPTPVPSAPPVTVPPAEAAVTHMDYTGPVLPNNATMDKYALGLTQTTDPVTGWWVSSGFGWREHPVDGGEKFHNGVDLAVNDGTPVLAFAAGTVDYIGESPIYGLYTQIRHENGVTTFYAHNSKLCVQQGQTVQPGDKVAESGETGNATGPHLHFELKKDGKLLNPLYYIKAE